MIKRLQSIGNSVGVILDRALLELIGVRPDGEVELSVEGKSITLRPVDPSRRKAQMRQAATRVIKKRRNTLKRLAQ